MATTRNTDEEISQPEPLGKEGETCAQCGRKLAVDQRYCLNCGTARAEPRLDYARHLPGEAAAPQKATGSSMQWSPLLAIVAIAILGVMLLLGVLIGQDDTSVTVTEVPATTSTTPTTASTPTETVPTTPTTDTSTTPSTGTTTPDTGGNTQPQNGDASGGVVPND